MLLEKRAYCREDEVGTRGGASRIIVTGGSELDRAIISYNGYKEVTNWG